MKFILNTDWEAQKWLNRHSHRHQDRQPKPKQENVSNIFHLKINLKLKKMIVNILMTEAKYQTTYVSYGLGTSNHFDLN
jgi:hypothetical protein